MRTPTALIALTAGLMSACAAPPQPPTVDGAARRPANSSEAVDLQRCRHDLHAARHVADDMTDRIGQATTALASLAAHRAALDRHTAPAELTEANTVFLLGFEHGSTRVDLGSRSASDLLSQARTAALVLLRGRTDGSSSSPAPAADARIARDRAVAVQRWLIEQGVAPARIRMTYQPVGDHVADNDSPQGRALNRRVEIELYRAMPEVLPLDRTTADLPEEAPDPIFGRP